MDLIDTLNQKALKGTGISASEALELFIEGAGSPNRVFAAASGLREQFKGGTSFFAASRMPNPAAVPRTASSAHSLLTIQQMSRPIRLNRQNK